jgi:hypothetical protein
MTANGLRQILREVYPERQSEILRFAQNDSEWAQDDSEWAQDDSEWAQDDSEWAQDDSGVHDVTQRRTCEISGKMA